MKDEKHISSVRSENAANSVYKFSLFMKKKKNEDKNEYNIFCCYVIGNQRLPSRGREGFLQPHETFLLPLYEIQESSVPFFSFPTKK